MFSQKPGRRKPVKIDEEALKSKGRENSALGPLPSEATRTVSREKADAPDRSFPRAHLRRLVPRI